jgi:TonB family protein
MKLDLWQTGLPGSQPRVRIAATGLIVAFAALFAASVAMSYLLNRGQPDAQPPAPVAMPLAQTLDEWKVQLVTLLQDNKEFPADMHCERGSVQVRFRLDMQGQIVSREVLTSSGLAGFDQEGLALLDRIGRFPPPPPTIGPESLEFTVPIQFDGKGDGCAPN